MYIHPLRVLNQGSPLIKYSALSNYNDDQFIWQGLERQSEIPELISYIEEKTDYPVEIITDIIDDFKKKSEKKYVLIIDGVENIIPQCTRYRVLNKAEQLEKLGYDVKVVNLSKLQLLDCKGASHIIIYRAPDLPILSQVCQLAIKQVFQFSMILMIWFLIQNILINLLIRKAYQQQIKITTMKAFEAMVECLINVMQSLLQQISWQKN